MYLNDKIALPRDAELTQPLLESLKPKISQLRTSGEVHVQATGTALILELLGPHNAIEGTPLTKEQMMKRGLSDRVVFFDLERIAFARNKVVLYPRRENGLRVDRKRTLTYHRNGWIRTYRTFFEGFRIVEAPKSTMEAQIAQIQRMYA